MRILRKRKRLSHTNDKKKKMKEIRNNRLLYKRTRTEIAADLYVAPGLKKKKSDGRPCRKVVHPIFF